MYDLLRNTFFMKSEKLISNLAVFFAERGFQKAVVGLSGGVDSAVTLAIAVAALGSENVYGLILPNAAVSSDKSRALATQVAAQFDVKVAEWELGELVEKFSPPWEANRLAQMNIAPRLRMMALYHFANAHDALVLGTSNKSEILLGYGTKWGDFAADVEVLGNLWKTEVYELAEELNIPQEIVTRPPTAELQAGQTDEEELGASYSELDEILQKFEENNFELPEHPSLLEKSILDRVVKNRHKTELPPILEKSK